MTTRFNRRKALQFGLAAGVGAGLLPGRAGAESMPDTARILVGFPPGGAPDLVSRRLAEQLNGKLAKSVIVDNRPGAGGRIAADVARQAPADGLTLLMNPAGMLTINPHVYKRLNYDPFKDFAPISIAAVVDFGFGVGPAVPQDVKSIADFSAWAKSNLAKASYGSPAAGAPPHFVGDAVSRALGIHMTHIAYRGGSPALNDLMGGQLTSLVLTLGDMIQNARAGRLRLLASTGPARSRFSPQVPTFAEQKVHGLDHRDWFGVYIAGKPSPAVLARVGPLVRGALSSRDYILGLNSAGIEASSGTPS
ncbi:MAG: tripartite tricarboxylate transporter substrate-binding protein, partial [Ramlibacter sp.]